MPEKLNDPDRVRRSIELKLLRAFQRRLICLDRSYLDYPKDWERKRYHVKDLDGYTCLECRKSQSDGIVLQVHHIVFRSNGGTNSEKNLVTLCFACHQAQHDHPISQHGGEPRGREKDESVKDEESGAFQTSEFAEYAVPPVAASPPTSKDPSEQESAGHEAIVASATARSVAQSSQLLPRGDVAVGAPTAGERSAPSSDLSFQLPPSVRSRVSAPRQVQALASTPKNGESNARANEEYSGLHVLLTIVAVALSPIIFLLVVGGALVLWQLISGSG